MHCVRANENDMEPYLRLNAGAGLPVGAPLDQLLQRVASARNHVVLCPVNTNLY